MRLLLVLLVALQLPAQNKQAKQDNSAQAARAVVRGQTKTDWNAPFPAHKVIGNVYYVGSSELASFLITTPQGHFLIKTDYEATDPVILDSD